jgi:hypothetical protein
MKRSATKQIPNPNRRVKTYVNTKGEFEVRVMLTQEVLATFDSIWVAAQMVCRINRNLSK